MLVVLTEIYCNKEAFNSIVDEMSLIETTNKAKYSNFNYGDTFRS